MKPVFLRHGIVIVIILKKQHGCFLIKMKQYEG